MLTKVLGYFWRWYERHYTLNLILATLLFFLQVIHLYWLSADVVAERIIGTSYFTPNEFWEFAILIVDYFEIPAIISVSFIYLNDLRKRRSAKSILYLLFLNSQWLHIFWITDEFVVDQLTGTGAGTVLPAWLAWLAIAIDYLELPVMFDTLRRAITATFANLRKNPNQA